MVLALVLSVVGVYTIYRILLLLGTIITAPLLTLANVIYRIYHPPNFPISYYVFGNGVLSLLTFPLEYAVWIVYKVVSFVVMLPFNCLGFVINLVISAFSLLNTLMLSVVAVKLLIMLVSVYYFRNLLFKYIPLDLSDFSLEHIGALLSSSA